MKVLQVIPSLAACHGGPSVAVRLIARCLAQGGVEVDIATTDDDGPGRHLSVPLGRRLQDADGYGVLYFRKQTEFYKASLPFRRWLAASIAGYDLVHIHALFSYTSNCAARQARRQAIPYVVRPLGVLNRWGLKNRRPLLKSLSRFLVERRTLAHAAAMHYTSRAEQEEAGRSGASARAAVIPIGIELAQFSALPPRGIFLRSFPVAVGRKLVLFLSRIDPKKGLELLLPAFAEVRRSVPEALLVIAGDGEPGYVAGLRRLAEAQGLAGDILWTGFLQGSEKLSAMASAEVFVLPSHSENFGIALVEALAAGIPSVLTPGIAIAPDVAEFEAGLVVPYAPEAIAAKLIELLRDGDLRQRLGRNAIRLAEERFSLEAMQAALLRLYTECT